MADDYERLAEKTELTYDEALALKKEMLKREENEQTHADLVHPAAGWRVATRMTKSEAVNFLNESPPTLPGEASVTNRADGTVDIYWYGHPSSL
jgi:chromosome segregation and condensation protein ScpB